MAVSNEEVIAWLAANPLATDAEIAQAALASGVSSSQLAEITGLPVSDVEARITDVLPYVAPPIEERTVDMGEGTRSEYFVKGTNIRVDAPTYTEDYSQGPLTESSEATRVANNIKIYDPVKQVEYVYSPSGQYVGSNEGARDSSFLGGIKEIVRETAPIWSAALTAGGAGSALGSTVAPGLGAGAQGAIGGALLGGGTAALTGGDVLQQSLLGGAGGYLSGTMNAPTQESIYSLANGPSNLGYMGGGQGLTSTGAANLASMGGAQGLQIFGGLPSTTLAEALNSFAGVNPSVLADMGLGTGITYVTPSGIVTENGTIISGDVISELGKNTGFDLTQWLNENIGAGLGTELGAIDTGITSGLPVSSALTTAGTAAGTTAGTSAGTDAGIAAGGITAGKVLDAAKLAAIIGGAGATLSNTGNKQGFGIVPVPTDWKSPIYTQATQTAPLPPIDFGSRELLRGTQWEKYLNPVVAPEPTVPPAAQGGIGYNQLTNMLQTGQGGNLTLNDIISGIQGQYGQNATGTVGR